MNVLPFVRRHSEAKALWDTLVGLYGAENGIARAGGPAISRIEAVGGEGCRGLEIACTEKDIVVFVKGNGKGKGGEKGREVVGGGLRRGNERK